MNRWHFVRELFEETVALDASERARVLNEKTDGDLELVRRVEALVAADATPLGAFDRGATDLLQDLRSEPPAEDLCGESFGQYRIEEHLSAGGMAHVYRATRTSAGTQRRVALKVLRHGLDTEAFLERFQRERETLAALEHENVVSFMDAGALPDGRPYLVMELVEGVPLTTWGRDVSLGQRLELFLQVIKTVQYAHQQLVVHRDLKPSNVLVTSQGVPKLLDFGVAAVLESEGEVTSGGGPLTPAYASPEQLRGGPITTASDVFSLGVLLHELVTGDLPLTGKQGFEVGVEGDLGLIVQQALALDPDRRYRSADSLADDLRRTLAHEPISARAGSWNHRASLFMRRNPWPLALVAAVLVALVVGWVGSDLDRRFAERDAGQGWGAHAQARVVARVFEDWIAESAAADPEFGGAVAAHLEQALRDELADLPEAETLVRLMLANLYLDRGDPELAAQHAERAWTLAQTTRGVGFRDRERAAALRDRVRVGG